MRQRFHAARLRRPLINDVPEHKFVLFFFISETLYYAKVYWYNCTKHGTSAATASNVLRKAPADVPLFSVCAHWCTISRKLQDNPAINCTNIII